MKFTDISEVFIDSILMKLTDVLEGCYFLRSDETDQRIKVITASGLMKLTDVSEVLTAFVLMKFTYVSEVLIDSILMKLTDVLRFLMKFTDVSEVLIDSILMKLTDVLRLLLPPV
jgi:hypothetical protein